eukprot:scaffold48029_cov69-Phaeocystis_antarctica.AAC.8
MGRGLQSHSSPCHLQGGGAGRAPPVGRGGWRCGRRRRRGGGHGAARRTAGVPSRLEAAHSAPLAASFSRPAFLLRVAVAHSISAMCAKTKQMINATIAQSDGGDGDGGGGEGHTTPYTTNAARHSTSMRPHRATLWTNLLPWEPLTTACTRETRTKTPKDI